MNKFEKIIEIDNQTFEIYKNATYHLSDLLNKSEFSHTTEICFMFMSGTNFLKNSVFDCSKNDDFYSVNVLFRSVLEHYFRFQYFWFNNINCDDDSYAFKFRTALDFKEKLDMERTLNNIRNIEKIKTISADKIWEKLVQENPEFKKFTKEEISDFSKNLSIKNIIYFIENKIRNDGFSDDDFLKKVIAKYWEMSSFVHGGLHAHKKMVSMKMDENRQNQLTIISGLTLQAATFVKLFSYLSIAKFNPEFLGFYKLTMKQIQELNNYR